MVRRRFVAVLFLLATAATAGRASVVPPLSLDKLIESADFVFTGTVLRVEARWTPTQSGRAIVTHVTFGVERTLKGEPVRELSLEFLGGRIGDMALEVSGVPQFEIGQRSVIFARTRELEVSPLAGFNQGRFRVNRDPATGRQYVTTHDGWAFSSVAEIGRERAEVSERPVRTMTLEAFEQEIVRLERASRQ
jgi:hypothetical protein